MADVFISYSRVDQSFVKVLNQALNQSQYDAWVDWEDIPPHRRLVEGNSGRN